MLYKKRRRYKYNLHEEVVYDTGIKPDAPADLGLVTLDADGRLTIRPGYAWDGPSGPTIDTPSFMRGSLVHDALYQLLREGKLPQHRRKAADRILSDICREDGMSKLRAAWVYRGVRAGGASSARPDMLTAP